MPMRSTKCPNRWGRWGQSGVSDSSEKAREKCVGPTGPTQPTDLDKPCARAGARACVRAYTENVLGWGRWGQWGQYKNPSVSPSESLAPPLAPPPESGGATPFGGVMSGRGAA